jgi:hypothetical protein
MWGRRARHLARAAGLAVVRVAEPGAVRLTKGVLEVGPGASPSAIATIACRHELRQAGGVDETHVRALVQAHGFDYEPAREYRRSSGVVYRAVC